MLKHFFKFKRVEWKFSEYPSPFNLLFRTSVENHAAQDMSLDMAHKFFLPDKVVKKDDQVILLFNTGGKSHTDKVKILLRNFLPLLEQALVFAHDSAQVVVNAHYLFVYDADDLGVDNVRAQVSADFAQIDDSPWLQGPWAVDESNRFSAIIDNKGLYVWGEKYDYGTLEDILFPLYECSLPQESAKTVSIVDDIFKWDISSKDKKYRSQRSPDEKNPSLPFWDNAKNRGCQ